ncbi:hypothetical protein CDD81_3996 [Ophiocordyceps australis]|uniref:Uncharacterized protein n=1 Tax=Ophiocordyceps australis TaxID=1399860 RepID=A0A2C5YCP7_9HYPO|nr:hypothetical protein CDD81_3996 [Ophiocordyceps australis]
MLFSTVATAIALATGAAASPVTRNKHVADFRVYGGTDCYQQNMGVWTVIDTDFRPNECKSLKDTSIKSVSLVDINNGCKLHIFTDSACSKGRQTIPQGQCRGSHEGYKAWAMECS